MKPSLSEIVNRASVIFDVGPRDIRSASQFEHMIAARRGITLVGREAGYSYRAIGEAIEQHHTTVMHSFCRGLSSLGSDAAFTARVEDLRLHTMGEMA